MSRRAIPTGLLPRAAATGRLAAHLGRAAARRVVRRSEDDDRQLGEAMFSELDKLKGIAMKVGQILSYMEVGLPEHTQRRLARLQQGVEPLAFDVIERQVVAELGQPLADLFDRFDPDPVAAASIGQVHRASLEGREVAVKIRYPSVRDTLDSDFRHLHLLGRLASVGTAVDGPSLVQELHERIVEECDYSNEARNQAEFGRIFCGDPSLRIPAVVVGRCSEAVLTTEWHDGLRFEELASVSNARRNAIARTLVRFPFTSLFGHGVLHADPHPGNFLFPEVDAVVVLDFGCVKRLTARQVEDFRDLVHMVLDGRRGDVRELGARSGLTPRPDRIDFDELYAMLAWMFAPYTRPAFRFDRSWWDEGLRFTRPSNRNARHQGMPPHWLWLQRTVWGLHAVLMRLEVEVDLRDTMRSCLALSHTSESR